MANEDPTRHRLLGEYVYKDLTFFESVTESDLRRVPEFSLDGDVVVSSFHFVIFCRKCCIVIKGSMGVVSDFIVLRSLWGRVSSSGNVPLRISSITSETPVHGSC